MHKRKMTIGLLSAACIIFALSGCSDRTDEKEESVSEAEGMIFESEEEVLENLEPREGGYTKEAYYTSDLGSSDFPFHMRLVDTDGVVQEPVYEIKVTGDDEVISDQNEYQGQIYYVPVFKFSRGDFDITDMTVSEVISTGLTYWVDDEGNVIYNPPIDDYRFPFKADGGLSTGVGCSEETIEAQENGSEFLELFSEWIDEVHENGEIIKKGQTKYFDTIVQYDVEYPNYYEVISYRGGSYDCYTWPVGNLSIEVRERSDGKYEIIEKRNYYLDQDFLENTAQYDEEILKENAKKLSVNTVSDVGDAIGSAITLEASSLNPAVDETVMYLADMPDELRTLIQGLQNILN